MKLHAVVIEHASYFVDRSPWQVLRDAGLVASAQIEAYRTYQHAQIVCGIDVYNVEAEAWGASVRDGGPHSLRGSRPRRYVAGIMLSIRNIDSSKGTRMGRLDQKVAIVTGAGHGIGEGIARMFALQGAAVLVADKNVETGETVAASICSAGGDARFLAADITRTDDLGQIVAHAVDCWGRLNILVNNAAIPYSGASVFDKDMEYEFDRIFLTNTKSVWMAIHFAVPHLQAAGGGSIINVASVHALASAARCSTYSASKGALVSGTRSMAVELAPHRIRVNCISPGSIVTRDRKEWIRQKLTQAQYDEFLERFGEFPRGKKNVFQPLPDDGLPEDIAYCAVYLASDEARFCTGANFAVDGGLSAMLAPERPTREVAEQALQEREIREWLRPLLPKRQGESS